MDGCARIAIAFAKQDAVRFEFLTNDRMPPRTRGSATPCSGRCAL